MKEYLENVRCVAPLIHNITNYVTANDVANVLLACGASPIMADEEAEVEEITAHCMGLNLNLGTLNQKKIPAMQKAGKMANKLGHVVVLDPVGVGASSFRKQTAEQLLKEVRFDAIRGNISEIKTLASLCGTQEKNSGNMAMSDTMDVEKITDKSDHCGKITGIDGSGRGVDADNADTVTEENLAQHISNAKMLSKKLQTIVAITGAIDLVTDGSSCYVIRNGNPQMGHVTGAGCQLSGILTAFLAANPENKLQAAAAAVCMMGYAGELAAEKSGQSGSGTYRVSLMDAVSCMDGDILERGARYEIR